MSNEILNLIYSALDELAEQNPTLPAIPREPGVALYGEGGRLDSLSLVTLIVLVTERVQDHFDLSLSLVDEKAFSLARSPFRSARALADYIQGQVQAARSKVASACV